MPKPTRSLAQRNRSLAMGLAALVLGMAMLAWASVPLYRLFCQITGFAGTTQRAEEASKTMLEQRVHVRFNSDVAADLPWQFKPSEPVVVMRIGETRLTTFQVKNTGHETIVGTATYNVVPQELGPYFNKLECFCYNDITLKPGEARELPVSFFVDPTVAENPYLKNIDSITLSYTFFPSKR